MAKRRCAALVNQSVRALDIAMANGGEAAAARLLRHQGACRAWAVVGSPYCRAHQLSRLGTGPRTEAGRRRSEEARRQGYAHWVEERRAAGLPARTGGRGRGTPSKTPEQREREHREKETRQALKRIKLQQLAERRARHEAQRREREELAELEHRRQAANRGLPFWSDAAAPPPKPVPRGRSTPARQAHPSHSWQARELEKLERTFLHELNAASHPTRTPLDPAEVEAMYQRIIEYESMISSRGRERRLERLRFEVEAWRNRMAVDAAVKRAAALIQRASPDAAPAPHRPPPDDFRDSICPAYTVESPDHLRIEIDDRKRRLAQFNLAESTARSLDAELARVGSEAAQLAVLDRWLAGLDRAYAMTEAIVAGRDAARELRAARPREERPRLIDPRFK